MQARPIPLTAVTSSFFPASVSRLLRPLEPALNRMFLPDQLLRKIPECDRPSMTAVDFGRELLGNLDIHYHADPADLERLPTSGPALVVANHPFGLLEGPILLDLLESARADYRIVANSLLSNFPPLRQRVIFVDPFEETASPQANGRALRASLEWLAAGGLLVMFPAGEVAHLDWDERSVVDPPWNSAAARLARKVGCPTLPLFFDGANSHLFQMAGAIHPRLRTLNLFNELLNKRSRTIRVRVGNSVSASTLRQFVDAQAATEYLRARTYLLGNRPLFDAAAPHCAPRSACVPVAAAASTVRMRDEIAALPPQSLLAESAGFAVHIASAAQIPLTLTEIGRCRELTYREAGEGTGRDCDLDRFDDYYQHIVLWQRQHQRVAGAYRMAATPDVLPVRGITGLYSSTLFHYQPAVFERIGPALELGRSFICREYQKQYQPLLLLWKGILQYVQRRPECAVLFGAVSISNEYQPLSQSLIVDFLDGHLASQLSTAIRPRRGFRRKAPVPRNVRQLSRLLPTVEELSSSIQDLEADHKGLPVLIRQYLKVGGQLLSFNVDPKFSNVLDVLVMADLRTASGPMLERCLGSAGSAVFRAWHQRPATASSEASRGESVS